MEAKKHQWWSSLSDECPITLEPLSTLPYPPFILSDQTLFDGLALATYIVSQGVFLNPLTREALTYEDCARLDEYLNRHIYNHDEQNKERQEHLSSVLGVRGSVISVKEAFTLRDSIKVNVGGGRSNINQSESQRRRADVLRNEATGALRGLFVFGHHSSQGNGVTNNYDWVGHASSTTPSLSRAPGGFNLNHNPNESSNLDHLWGMESSNEQEGLRMIDDDEAALESADGAAWREVQEAFPTIAGKEVSQQPSLNAKNENAPSEILETVRQTANLTLIEEKQNAQMLERIQQRCFLQALERKRNRIDARRKAKEEAATAIICEKKGQDTLRSAREEIERWREQQWAEWDRVASVQSSNAKARSKETKAQFERDIELDSKVEESPSSRKQELSAEENAEKAAAKKKVKRAKAKERAKRKKQLERIEIEKKERASAILKEKEESENKCGACGVGILGCGFEKFGISFCSTKCARSGPTS